MGRQEQTVDWHAYAEKYDMLLEYNPFYQALQEEVLELVEEWNIPSGSCLVDVGAGTGNYSINLAERFPEARVIHIDKNTAMNERALLKKKERNLTNLAIYDQGIESVRLEPGSVQGLLSVHALYAFPDPQRALIKMRQWLAEDGRGILVDPGRIVNVIDWQLAIGFQLIARYGILKTIQILREGKPVSQQNRYIRQMQKQGKLWTHSPDEFRAAIENAGFKVLETRTCFRGLSDLAAVSR